MRVIVEFVGGPMDGTTVLERMPKQGEEFASWEEAIVFLAYSQTRGKVGKRFLVLSSTRLTRTAVREGGESGFPTFTYEVTDSLSGDDEILIRAKFVKQNP